MDGVDRMDGGMVLPSSSEVADLCTDERLANARYQLLHGRTS